MDKGFRTEELLRNFFLRNGYFVARGVPFAYQGSDVTDIDLWAYAKSHGITRERSIVDIKNKRVPQAMERIIVAKGLQSVLLVENVFVATNDKRKQTIDFGKEHNVTVLDGNFMSIVSKFENPNRLSEEEYIKIILRDDLGGMYGSRKSVYFRNKSMLLDIGRFSNFNDRILDIRFLFEQIVSYPELRESACRLVYLVSAFTFIELDYILRNSILHSVKERYDFLNNGVRYGDLGFSGAKDFSEKMTILVESVLGENKPSNQLIQKNLLESYNGIRSELIAEYFSDYENVRQLFKSAVYFENTAYSREFLDIEMIPSEHLSLFYVLLDFLGASRMSLYDQK